MKDILGRTVKVGDKVLVVCKEYGYRKIVDAYMVVATYDGDTKYYSNFLQKGHSFRIANPSVYKL